MNEEKLEKLNIEEQELISEMLLNMIEKYPQLPKEIVPQFQSLKDGSSLGIFTLQGAVYLAKDILGGFKAQFPFSLVYRTMPSSNGQRVNSQKILDELGKWLEQIELPTLSDGRIVESLQRTSTTVLQGAYDNGVQDYKCNMNLIYRKDD